MNTSFSFQVPGGISGFANSNLDLILVLFAIAFLVAFAYWARDALTSVKILRRTLAQMFKRSSGDE
jgi:hypothetical protein